MTNKVISIDYVNMILNYISNIINNEEITQINQECSENKKEIA